MLDPQKRSQLKAAFEEKIVLEGSTPSWPAWSYWDEYADGQKLLLLLNSPDAGKFHKSVKDKLNCLLEIIKVADL